MRLLIDMNLSPKLADILVEKGMEASHWYQKGAYDAPDSEIMSYARENDYVVLTCDLDFGALLSSSHGKKPSVIQLRVQNYDLQLIAGLVSNAVLVHATDIENGAILSIDARRARLRILPL
jgi:predicted nuclease of predicted toxin-antitoxin system